MEVYALAGVRTKVRLGAAREQPPFAQSGLSSALRQALHRGSQLAASSTLYRMRRCTPWLELWLATACLLLLVSGCRSSRSPSSRAPHLSTTTAFTDVASRAGMRFRYGYGGRSPLDLMEITGGGAGFLDVDGDGWLDILLVGQRRCALYHNNHDGTFTDVTRASGLTAEGWWMGCAAADWDNDGHVHLFLAGYRGRSV